MCASDCFTGVLLETRAAPAEVRRRLLQQGACRRVADRSTGQRSTGWRVRGKGGAADVLGMKPTTLEGRMAKLGIKRTQK
jgi:hypothetical protein